MSRVKLRLLRSALQSAYAVCVIINYFEPLASNLRRAHEGMGV
jgi:hypothetical protein